MASTATGMVVPAGTDAFDPQGDIVKLARSIEGMTVVPVPNETARAALVAALGWTPTPERPMYVHRADAPGVSALEVTTNGTQFSPVGGTTVLQANPTGATLGGGGGTLGITSSVAVEAAPFARTVRLDFAGMATALSGGTLEVSLRRGGANLKRGRSTSANVSAGGSHTETLAAGAAAAYQVVASTTAAATITSDGTFTYLTATVTPA